ncbi:hypothetical protein [Haliangium ochraceum]|uniref:Uncharacterized protein n=1 Tax=Haliangium ochraceum (strain DSM 14365 / JCM 11303 / SMP-2) TaxID=502025 RepID=D0LNU0_HALO1|nr:hypothetical protein [Haliangium ochraceum]ACY18766.1 hypothetical protein Hoch_6295 [Haliangium ochraceum DSM 14365]
MLVMIMSRHRTACPRPPVAASQTPAGRFGVASTTRWSLLIALLGLCMVFAGLRAPNAAADFAGSSASAVSQPGPRPLATLSDGGETPRVAGERKDETRDKTDDTFDPALAHAAPGDDVQPGLTLQARHGLCPTHPLRRALWRLAPKTSPPARLPRWTAHIAPQA